MPTGLPATKSLTIRNKLSNKGTATLLGLKMPINGKLLSISFGNHLVFFGCHVFIILTKSLDNLVKLGPGPGMVPQPDHAAEGVDPDVRVPPVVHRDVEIIPKFFILFEDL